MRALQSGFLRAYAALLLLGAVAVALYFLLQSLVTIHLSILLWLPARRRRCSALLLPRASRRARSPRSARSPRWATRSRCWSTSTRGARACSTSPTRCGSRSSGIHYKLGVDGLNLFLILLATLLFFACDAVGGAARVGAPAACSTSGSASAETAVLGALMAQDLALFVVFFDLMLCRSSSSPASGARGAATACAAITKLFIYTLVGSLLMLAAAIATGVLAPSRRAPTCRFVFSRPREGATARRRARRSGSSSASPRPSW